jgi:protein-S-isoprenylcysteine O-methyltransferase Ste14
MALIMIVLLHLQVLREEHFLTDHYGERFLYYKDRVGQYGPWSLWLKEKGPM